MHVTGLRSNLLTTLYVLMGGGGESRYYFIHYLPHSCFLFISKFLGISFLHIQDEFQVKRFKRKGS